MGNAQNPIDETRETRHRPPPSGAGDGVFRGYQLGFAHPLVMDFSVSVIESPPMSSPEFYREARSYDIAFSDRDFVDECNFLEHCLREFGDVDTAHAQARAYLELACGPARHAREFARRSWRAVGLDLSPDMLEYAQEGAAGDGVRIESACADMTNFRLQEPVALASNLMESLSHLTTNEQVVAHMRAVASNLLPGGIFVIEMAHPDSLGRECLPNTWMSRSTDSSAFDGQPYTEVDVLFGSADDPYDYVTQIWTVTTCLQIREDGQPPRTIEHHYQHRWYLPQELRALVDLSGAFSQQWWFGNMVVPPLALDNSSVSDRLLVVLRK
jgi:SAM-dependent methyltransferase